MRPARPIRAVLPYLAASMVIINITGIRTERADATRLRDVGLYSETVCGDLPGGQRDGPRTPRNHTADIYCPHLAVLDPALIAIFDRNWPPNVERWRRLFERLFRPEDVETALRVVNCESRGDPEAKNPQSSASGLWQHLERYWHPTWNGHRVPGGNRAARAGVPGADIFDPIASTVVAAWLVYEAGGWIHWPCF